MIKTINLNGSEVKVTELGGDNTQIFNNSGNTLYASKKPNITVGGDDVIAIPAGAVDGLYGTRGTVYLLGSGSVEVRGVDHKITNVRSATVINETGGVTEENVNQKCAAMLDSAKAYADEKDNKTLESAKEYADSLNAELAGYIGYTDNDVYGLEADFENCVFTRLAGAVGKNAGADFDSVNAYGGRRRCNLSDSGEVLAYYGDENFKADGSNGQVMVEQPKFYYRVVPLKTEKINGADGYHLRKARYYISDTPKAGFKVHPAFVRNGVEVDRIYLSAFEGCIYDTSAGTYLLNDEQIVDFGNDKLSSIAGAKPCSGQTQQLTRANARKLAHSRGKGWELCTIQTVSATQMLFVIEYAGFNSQELFGLGNVSKTDDNSTNMSEKTGLTLSLGNTSGNYIGSNNVQIISYRSEENLWGNIWTQMDGINITNPNSQDGKMFGEIFISDHDFVDNNQNNPYVNARIPSLMNSGYTSAFGYSYEFDWLFAPTERCGNNALPIGDYSTCSTAGWRFPLLGGNWKSRLDGGLFCFGELTSFDKYRSFGTRITFIHTQLQKS